MTAAILFAFASAAFLGAGVVTAQFGLAHGRAAVGRGDQRSLLHAAVPAAVAADPARRARGLARACRSSSPSGCSSRRSLTLLTFASNRALGPVVTSTLGNLAPLFAVALAVAAAARAAARRCNSSALVIAVAGAVIITVTRPRDLGNWRSWALLLPLGSALVRGVVPPIVKLGLEVWPSPLWACLIGYIMSSLVVLTVQRVRKGSFVVAGAAVGPALVRRHRHLQRAERADAVCRRAPRADHAGGAAGRDLSAGHGGPERDPAQAHRDHRRASSPEPR